MGQQSGTASATAEAGAATPLWVALGLALGPAAVLGLGRFAYALLLPPMRADLGWTYAQAGAVNAANAAGYLAGALVAARVSELLGAKRSFVLGLLATAAALMAAAFTRDLWILLGLRTLAGLAAAAVFVSGGGLVAVAGISGGARRAPLLLAIYFAGPGIGIVLSGPLISPIVVDAPARWPWGWIALAAATLASVALSAPAVVRTSSPVAHHATARSFAVRPLIPIFVTYTLFGGGYIAYMTFIVAFLRAEGTPELQIALFWAVLGAAAISAAFLWGPVLAHLSARWGVFAVMVGVLAGAVLPLLVAGAVAVFGSAALFGGSFLAVVTAVTHVARMATPPTSWTRVIGALTVAFALGQCLGPIFAGILSDGPGGLRAGMLLSAGLLAAGAVAALCQRDPRFAEHR